MDTVDVPIPARDIRQCDHIVPADGTVRVVVAVAERNDWFWIGTHGEVDRRYWPDEPVILRGPTRRTSPHAYYIDAGRVYRHAGSGVFKPAAAVLNASTT